jgi:RimJ/RimL family protein N-acetyltransferase
VQNGFDVVGLDRVLAQVAEPNTGSARMLEKLGMTLVGRETVAGRPLLLYEVERRRFVR